MIWMTFSPDSWSTRRCKSSPPNQPYRFRQIPAALTPTRRRAAVGVRLRFAAFAGRQEQIRF